MLKGSSARDVERATFFTIYCVVGKSIKRIASGELNLISLGYLSFADVITNKRNK